MRVLMACLALVLASPALALSCMRPDAVRVFEKARDATAAYYIVKGRVSLREAANKPEPNSKTSAVTRAHVSGSALTASGFNVAFDQDIDVASTCLGPWCGDPDSLTGELIMALEIRPGSLRLHLGPCGGDQLPWHAEQEMRLLQCHLSGDCQLADF